MQWRCVMIKEVINLVKQNNNDISITEKQIIFTYLKNKHICFEKNNVCGSDDSPCKYDCESIPKHSGGTRHNLMSIILSQEERHASCSISHWKGAVQGGKNENAS